MMNEAATEAARLVKIVFQSGFCPYQISDGPRIDCDYPNCQADLCDFSERGDIIRKVFTAFTVSLVALAEKARLEALSEREACQDALRQKDAAMNILFDRLQEAGIDVSDLMS